MGKENTDRSTTSRRRRLQNNKTEPKSGSGPDAKGEMWKRLRQSLDTSPGFAEEAGGRVRTRKTGLNNHISLLDKKGCAAAFCTLLDQVARMQQNCVAGRGRPGFAPKLVRGPSRRVEGNAGFAANPTHRVGRIDKSVLIACGSHSCQHGERFSSADTRMAQGVYLAERREPQHSSSAHTSTSGKRRKLFFIFCGLRPSSSLSVRPRTIVKQCLAVCLVSPLLRIRLTTPAEAGTGGKEAVKEGM